MNKKFISYYLIYKNNLYIVNYTYISVVLEYIL